MTDQRITLRFDGGSRGNPGPAAIGVVLETDDGTPVFTLGRFIGHATSNVAEYRALAVGLKEARKLGVRTLRVLGDSELVIKQLLGEYRVKNETLKLLYAEAIATLRTFEKSEVGHNRRGHNSLADTLANLAMDKQRDVTDEDIPSGGYSPGATDDAAPEGAPAELECPRCNCTLSFVRQGQIPEKPRPFLCRCGTPMRGK